jgi:hypothetical protein
LVFALVFHTSWLFLLQWIDRVKEFLMNGVEADIDSLQELLDETEGMPVAMVEADLLRYHLFMMTDLNLNTG